VAEHHITLRVLEVIIQRDARAALAQDAGERRLADLDRLPPQVRAIQLQQVEGVQERLGLVRRCRST
jgi:hypothetical protein